jgi:NhaA family Na+:H+ antiporter
MRVIRNIVSSPSFGGILLFTAAVLAIVLSNSALSGWYDALLHTRVAVAIGEMELAKPLLLWINDGLMAMFFLLVGLEIKREALRGVLRNRDQIVLPTVGALGGLLLPALIFSWINWDDPVARHGWAIPAATDIAFSLGILALLGKRVPISLKIFLTALAIIDDIGAIIIIALFYTSNLSVTSLIIAFIAIIALVMMNRIGVKRVTAYVLVGVFLWLAVLKSGVHATLAGIVLAFAIPLEENKHTGISPLIMTEHALSPWVNYLVLPVFAFANTGFSLAGLKLSSLTEPVTLGIVLGLFVGKQIGIFSSCWLLIKFKLAALPDQINWHQLYAVSILCGVGFTMSLFIGMLAFEGQAGDYTRMVRLGVLTGSTISGVLGYLVLRYFTSENRRGTQQTP